MTPLEEKTQGGGRRETAKLIRREGGGGGLGMEREERRGEERSFGDKGGRIHTLRLGREACRRNRTSQRKTGLERSSR